MATFKKSTTINNGDHEEIYSEKRLMGTIREQNGLWKVIVRGGAFDEVLYLETRAQAAEYACIVYWYTHGKVWYTET